MGWMAGSLLLACTLTSTLLHSTIVSSSPVQVEQESALRDRRDEGAADFSTFNRSMSIE